MSSSIPEGYKIDQERIANGQRLPDNDPFGRTFIGGKRDIQNGQSQTVLGDAGRGDGAHRGGKDNKGAVIYRFSSPFESCPYFRTRQRVEPGGDAVGNGK